jgi:putative transcriptional regulator
MPPERSAERRICVRLDELLHQRRMTLTELAERIGITLANLSILKTGKAKAIRFSTLEAICRELDCQPGDLLACECDAEEGPAEGSEQQGDRDQQDDQGASSDDDGSAHGNSP